MGFTVSTAHNMCLAAKTNTAREKNTALHIPQPESNDCIEKPQAKPQSIKNVGKKEVIKVEKMLLTLNSVIKLNTTIQPTTWAAKHPLHESYDFLHKKITSYLLSL